MHGNIKTNGIHLLVLYICYKLSSAYTIGKKGLLDITWGRRDRDRMVVGFTTTYAMQSMPITTDVVALTPAQGEVYNIMG